MNAPTDAPPSVPRITVVGLGPGDPALLTLGASEAIRGADALYLRTTRHPTVDALGLAGRAESFDSLYNTLPSVDDVYAAIADRLVAEASERPGATLVYAVPGSPSTGERSVAHLRERSAERGVELAIAPAVSAVEAAQVELGLDPLAPGSLSVDAPELSHLLETRPTVASQFLNPTLPLLVGGIWNRSLASDVKLFLLANYPPGWVVRLVRAGLGQRPVELPLEELDRRSDLDHLTTLYVPPLPLDAPGSSFYELTHIIARLRGPGGCQWDREQTHATLKRYLLEEAYEAMEAIDEGDPAALEEELGDVLIQVSLNSEVAYLESDFDIGDVIRTLTTKMVRRHPHVFGEVRADDASQVLANWQAIKQGEKAEKGVTHSSVLDGVPRELPALARAQSVSKRAARTGFDWGSPDEVLDKVREEVAEVAAAGTEAERLEEFGDLLFVLVNWARFTGLEAEEALRLATRKFERRFRALEARVHERAASIDQLSPAELDAVWDDVKRGEGPVEHLRAPGASTSNGGHHPDRASAPANATGG